MQCASEISSVQNTESTHSDRFRDDKTSSLLTPWAEKYFEWFCFQYAERNLHQYRAYKYQAWPPLRSGIILLKKFLLNRFLFLRPEPETCISQLEFDTDTLIYRNVPKSVLCLRELQRCPGRTLSGVCRCISMLQRRLLRHHVGPPILPAALWEMWRMQEQG